MITAEQARKMTEDSVNPTSPETVVFIGLVFDKIISATKIGHTETSGIYIPGGVDIDYVIDHFEGLGFDVLHFNGRIYISWPLSVS